MSSAAGTSKGQQVRASTCTLAAESNVQATDELPRFGICPEPWERQDLYELLLLVCAFCIGACFSPAALLGRFVFGTCPLVPRWRVMWLMFSKWKTHRPAKVQLRLTVFWLSRYLRMPFWACCYYLDELINLTRAMIGLGSWKQVQRPIFEISNRRSGSTDLGIKLGSMEGVYAPTFVQVMYPFLWLWQLECILASVGLTTPSQLNDHKVSSWGSSETGKEWRKMQHVAPSKPGTYEAATSMWTAVLGPVGLFAEGCGTGYGYDPQHKAKDLAQFVQLTEKLLLKCSSFVPGSRVMIKGHMLYAAPQLASAHPGATFVCVLRDPEQQIRSSINWLYVTRSQSLQRKRCGEACWDDVVAEMQAFSGYWQEEAEFYGDDETPKDDCARLVLPFSEYIEDSPAAVSKILCAAGLVVSAEAVQQQLDRLELGRGGKGDRETYKFTVTLEQLGIAHLPAQWCEEWRRVFAKKLK